MIAEAIQKLIEREDLTEQEARAAMHEIMAGQATEAQMAGFLTALRMKGETAAELIGFLFAPRFHSSMKHVMPVRSQLKVRTVFNILGPLANPAGACFQVVGVFSPAVMELMASAFHGLGLESALVVHGADGVDEISISAATEIVE